MWWRGVAPVRMAAIEVLRATALWYLRTKDHKEVDALVTKDQVPLLVVGAKVSDSRFGSSLEQFRSLLRIPAVQLVCRSRVAGSTAADGDARRRPGTTTRPGGLPEGRCLERVARGAVVGFAGYWMKE